MIGFEVSMDGTSQQKALNELRHLYGKTAFAEDHLRYKRVGFKRGEKTISVIAGTWNEAIEALGKKVQP